MFGLRDIFGLKEKADTNETELVSVREEEIPAIITSQFKEIARLQENVETAMKKAEEAKESADRAYSQSAGFGHKRDAIEALQSATVDLAESQISAAEAQKVSFEYQEKLGKITQYLFGLGVANLASNRSVVRELELKLKGASKKELNDLARQEIVNVIKQLKAQEDIMNKQNELSQKIRQQEQRIIQQEGMTEEYNKILAENAQKDATQDRLLAENAQRDAEQDRMLAEQAAKDAEHDRLLAENAQRDEEQDRLLAEQAAKDAEHDRLLAENAQKDAEQDRLLAERAAKDAEHDRLLAESARKDAEHDRLLAESARRDEEQDRQLAEQAAKGAEHDRLLAESARKEAEHDRLLAQQAQKIDEMEKFLEKARKDKEEMEKKFEESQNAVQDVVKRLHKKTDIIITIISIVMAAAGIALACVHFFI